MSVPKRVYFSKVKEAREALASKSIELFDTYMVLIKEALAAQEFDVAQRGLQFLMEHIPKDEDGVTFLDPSIDKSDKTSKGPSGPVIKIGFALGGISPQKELPTAVIDVTPEETNE
jgi:hypothetical protein